MSNSDYSFNAPRQQLFAFPQDVIRSMLENPSSHKGLMKLYQTCKYFYSKHPILMLDHVTVEVNYEFQGYITHTFRIYGNFLFGRDISKLQVPIWLTNEIRFNSCGTCYPQIPKFYRYSVKKIEIDSAALQYDDFVLWTSEKNVTHFGDEFSDPRVYHPHDSYVPIEEILLHLSNIKLFCYFIDERCSTDTLLKLNDIKLNNKLEYLHLFIDDVHPTFDLNLFCDFITKNKTEDSEIYIMEIPESNILSKINLKTLDQKWKKEAHKGLKKIFSWN